MTRVAMGSTMWWAMSRNCPQPSSRAWLRPTMPDTSNHPSFTAKISFKMVAKKKVGREMPTNAPAVMA